MDCRYSPDGKNLAIINYRGDVLIFDGEKNEHKLTLTEHTTYVDGVAFSFDGKYLASCSESHQIIIYNVENNFSVCAELTDNGMVFGVCFSSCSKYLYSTNSSGELKKWEIDTGEIVCSVQPHSGYLWRLSISPDGKYLLTGGDDNFAQLFDSENLSVLHSFDHSAQVKAIQFNPKHDNFVVADTSPKVTLYDFEGETIHSFIPSSAVYCMRYLTPNILVMISIDGYITTLDMNNYQEIQRFFCNCENLWCSCDISPNKRHLVCGRCKEPENSFRIFQIRSSSIPEIYSTLLELSKPSGNVLSFLLSSYHTMSEVRRLVSAGIHMNQEEYNMIINHCWDLVDLNNVNGGNMHLFVEQNDNSESDDDD
eukprot:TRINITY_DN12382_c0_g1_i1.p1 TRINITY_DN12382_c0_g1~~TRINITY_DN12382_c0_g1_i1.p1  ORF type:complete len:412 (+),score=102.97 TRINITY_DN12382_c0_g1_i1:138-1238(+)